MTYPLRLPQDTALQLFWQQSSQLKLCLSTDETSLPCRAVQFNQPSIQKNLEEYGNSPLHMLAVTTGFHSGLAVPLVLDKKTVAALVFFTKASQTLDLEAVNYVKLLDQFLVGSIVNTFRRHLGAEATLEQLKSLLPLFFNQPHPAQP